MGLDKKKAADAVLEAKVRHGVTWAHLAEAIDRAPAWTVAALLGQHPVPTELADKVAAILELDADTTLALTVQPYRGPQTAEIPTDPTIYRFHEALMVYGPAIKELIHEEFGDGIMSAINFKLDVARRSDPGGDRVVVTFDGKFLDYQW